MLTAESAETGATLNGFVDLSNSIDPDAGNNNLENSSNSNNLLTEEQQQSQQEQGGEEEAEESLPMQISPDTNSNPSSHNSISNTVHFISLRSNPSLKPLILPYHECANWKIIVGRQRQRMNPPLFPWSDVNFNNNNNNSNSNNNGIEGFWELMSLTISRRHAELICISGEVN